MGRKCWKECPVYKDWCSYDYHDWPIVDRAATEGTTHEVTWPVLEAPDAEHRVTDVAEYRVRLERGSRAWVHQPKTLDEFRGFEVGSAWTVKVTHDHAKLLGIQGRR